MWEDFWSYFGQLLLVVICIIGALGIAIVLTGCIVLLIALFVSSPIGIKWIIGVVFVIIVLAIIAFIQAWTDNH